MDAAYEQKYHAMEDRHWWFAARRDLIDRLIRQQLRTPKNAAILELGCSGGPLLAHLKSVGYSNLCGIDISETAITRCRERGLTDVHIQDAAAPHLEDRRFDLLLASDILEHLEHPETALRNWRNLTNPGGKIIVLVPAFMSLWSGHDVLNHHFRRYRASELTSQLKATGWQIDRTSYWNAFLFPPTAAVRWTLRLLGQSSHPKDQLIPVRPGVNGVLKTLVRCENSLIAAGIRMPVGVSVLAIAHAN